MTPRRRRITALGRGGRLGAITLACLALMGLPARNALALTLVANPDSYTVRHDRTTTVAAPGVLANDLGLLGTSTAVLYSDVSRGTLSLQADGGLTYKPDPGFVGSDSFRYQARNNLLVPILSAPATVTISVTNATPVAIDDHYTAATGVQKNVPAPGVLGNDTDADGDALVAELLDGGGNGSIDLNADGSFSFKSGGSFVGDRTFTYRVSDGLTWSPAATFTITVGSSPTPTPPPPTPTPTPPPPPTPAPTVIIPLPSLPLPAPTIWVPLPTVRVPLPTDTPAPTLTATPAPTRSDGRPTAAPSDAGPDRSAEPAASDGGIGGGPTNSDGPNGAGAVNVPPIDPFTPIDGIGTIMIGGFDWVVPSLVLSVPGLLLILAVIAQTGAGLVAIPVVRRSLGGFGVSRRRSRAPSP